MEFDVSENPFCDFISDRSGKRDKHGSGEGFLHEPFHYRKMYSCERHDVHRFRTEAQCDGEFKEETDMEIAEIALNGIQKEDVLLAPLVKTFFVCTVLYGSIQDFCHEHGHRVLEHILADTGKVVFEGYVLSSIKI